MYPGSLFKTRRGWFGLQAKLAVFAILAIVADKLSQLDSQIEAFNSGQAFLHVLFFQMSRQLMTILFELGQPGIAGHVHFQIKFKAILFNFRK